jgi:hypothetical protein
MDRLEDETRKVERFSKSLQEIHGLQAALRWGGGGVIDRLIFFI